jgi:hypothetical protein
MRDKQYFTVDDLDVAHRSGVAYGLANSSKGAGNTGSRVERALELIRSKQGGTKASDSKAKDASKLLLGLGLSAAAISAATGGSRKENKEEAGAKDSKATSTSSTLGKAGTELPLGLTLDKDGKAVPAIDGKVSTMLGMVGKVASGVNPLLGAILGLGTSFLTKDLTGKAEEFNKAEDAKFGKLLAEKDKDFTDYASLATLLGGTGTVTGDGGDSSGSIPTPTSEPSESSAASEPSYTGSTY